MVVSFMVTDPFSLVSSSLVGPGRKISPVVARSVLQVHAAVMAKSRQPSARRAFSATLV
jgi:hypothetical protein